MKDEEFAAAVAMMPKETKNLLLSHYGLHPFSKIITDDLEKETEKEVFEIFSDGENISRETDDSCVPQNGGQDLYSEGQEDL